jgi:hypothetical protein
MVKQKIVVQGVNLAGITQDKPVLLQMNDDDFPNAFLRDLGAIGQTAPLSSTAVMPTGTANPVTLFQPVTRVFHLALMQLSCEAPGFPRLDPGRVLSSGLVIRQVPLSGGPPPAAWPWMRDANSQFNWIQRDPFHADDDPDPARRQQLQSGQPALDLMLAAQGVSSALTEITTPAFIAAPDVCKAAGRTLVYALIPTASSEAATQQASGVAPFDAATLTQILPTLLQPGSHSSPLPDTPVDYRWMSDEYVRTTYPDPNVLGQFQVLSLTLRLLYTSFGAFDGSPAANALLAVLNRRNVTRLSDDGSGLITQAIGQFFEDAAAKLIDYDPNVGPSPAPTLNMPRSWEFFDRQQDGPDLMNAMTALLQARGTAASVPLGRYQDATRLYRARLFFRIKGENSKCPPDLVWSCFSDQFRIAAWYESAGRPVAPVPLPDPFDRNVLKNAKPTSAFAVPPSLMNAIGGSNLSDLQKGKAGGPGGGIGLGWICAFSIPLITICAFFVLNIFISLLNICFFWIAFIKICIPFPKPKS